MAELDFPYCYYIKPSSKIYDILYDYVIKSYPNACIVTTWKIRNPYLIDNYEAQRAKFIKQYGNENEVKYVFHGTGLKAVANICKEGYKKEYSKHAAYIKGTYFAKNAEYSVHGYAKNIKDTDEFYLFVNDILLGEESDSGGSGNNIFVVCHDKSAIPRVFIAMQNNLMYNIF